MLYEIFSRSMEQFSIKKPGRIDQFEYELQVQDKAPFFVKPYPIGSPLCSKLLILLLPSLRCICSTKKLRNYPENTIKMPIKPRRFQKSRFFFYFCMLCRYANIESPKNFILSLMIAITLGCYNKTFGNNFKAKEIF